MQVREEEEQAKLHVTVTGHRLRPRAGPASMKCDDRLKRAFEFQLWIVLVLLASLHRSFVCYFHLVLFLSTMMRMRRGKRAARGGKGKFDPTDTKNVKHTRLGVWDLYEEIQPETAHLPGSSRFEAYFEMINSFPYVWRMITDIGSISECFTLLSGYLVLEVRLSIWRSSTLLTLASESLSQL